MPYLNQGEFYSEFGNYDVRITLPDNYVVAATGDLQNNSELKWLKEKALEQAKILQHPGRNPDNKTDYPASSANTKSLNYIQKNVHDFAWFADKRFIVNYDTLKLASGREVNIFSYYLPFSAATWKKVRSLLKMLYLQEVIGSANILTTW